MRRILLVLLAIILFVTVVGAATSRSLAYKNPSLPGDWLFSAQLQSEQWWYVRLVGDETKQAWHLLDLLARRIDNIEAIQGTDLEMSALAYYDSAFDQTVVAIGQAPESAQPELQARLKMLVDRLLALLERLQVMQTNAPETALLILQAKQNSLLQTLADANRTPAHIAEVAQMQTSLNPIPVAAPAQAQVSGGTLDSGHSIAFLDGASDNVAHSFFPLVGGHSNLGCDTCHSNGIYRNTNTACVACHAADEPHGGSFGTDCTRCHSIDAWPNVVFDHTLVVGTDCEECHTPPAEHYAGACSQCHTDTGNFNNAGFNHNSIGSMDCGECHTPPENHYAGACSQCHTDTGNFNNAGFNHDGIGNLGCDTCHTPPANHYAGACSQCHTDTNNFGNYTFNHNSIGSMDCGECHTPPENHYAGACSQCHTDTNDFGNYTFNHSGIGSMDCGECHTPPENHYAGACSQCHTDTNDFGNYTFNHNGFTDCQSCHTPPSNHFPGQCSQCHNTTNFKDTSFTHTFPIDHKEANGECAKCHPGNDTSSYTCANCHNQSKMDEKHKEVSGYSPDSCAKCHSNGKNKAPDTYGTGLSSRFLSDVLQSLNHLFNQ